MTSQHPDLETVKARATRNAETTVTVAAETGVDVVTVNRILFPAAVVDDTQRYTTAIHMDPVIGPAVRFLLLHGYGPHYIADVLELPLTKVARFAASPNGPTTQAKDIVAYAQKGLSVTAIAQALGVAGRGHIYRVLNQAHVTAATDTRHRTTSVQRAKALQLYRQGRSYSQIATATGLTLVNVKNVLRAAHRRGELPQYGARRKTAHTQEKHSNE